jgi:hypothetical protein
MNKLKLIMCASAATLGLGWAGIAAAQTATPAPAPAAVAAPSPPAASPAPYPSMSATLSANPNPAVFDAGPILGKLTVTGVVSGLGLWQTAPTTDFFGNRNAAGYADLSNATVMVQKTDGPIQFFLQAGAYSLPALGSPYVRANKVDTATFSYFQQGFIKIVPNANFSVEVGALPTLIGDEYTFTFENMNIQRGLLWNQENAVTKGVQVNYANGPLTVSASFNDGFDTNRYTSASGLISYAFDSSDTLAFVGMGSFSKLNINTFVAPVTLANSQIYNLIYTRTQGPWVISPYIQYTVVPKIPGLTPSGSTIGAAILAKYSFTPEFNLAGRIEYISSSGGANLLYGPGSNAWSVTLTPTYQKGIFFVRGEASYVGVGSGTPGLIFGGAGTNTNQTRVLGEIGFIF